MSDEDIQWWWIDYLENEFEPGLEADLQLLLEHSQEDRDSFDNFCLLRKWVKESDPVGEWPLEDRLKRVRASVMSAIESCEMEPLKVYSAASTNALRT